MTLQWRPYSSKAATEPMERGRLYQYLQLRSFSKEEFQQVFHKIRQQKHQDNHNSVQPNQIASFLLQRIHEIESVQHAIIPPATVTSSNSTEEKNQYVLDETNRFLSFFQTQTLTQDQFVNTLTKSATSLDMKQMWPITLSILLVGTSVGIVTPAMPFVVETIGLSPGEYGTVVGAFALAKMAGNIPSAVLVERHGRKPYLTFSLALIALGVGGIGAATTFEHLYLCRLLTGVGVAALTTASQLMVTDISTPLNRATTMSPIVSAFAAGTALGPAIGGALVDQVGLQSTFYLVGTSYLGVAMLNRAILQETKRKPFHFPWIVPSNKKETTPNEVSLTIAVKDALAQWVPLLQNPQIRSVMFMNGSYWFALAGSQMTLLPLLLTSPTPGLNMTASGVGQVYMFMSLVQVLSNPIMARYIVDRIGKAPSIAGGCGVIASSMICLPLCTDHWLLFVGTLGVWALGSSMLSTAPLAYISDKVDEAERAQAIAMLRTSGDLGFLFGASCVGGLADFTGSLELALQASGGLLSTATVWFILRQSLFHSGIGDTRVEHSHAKEKER